MKVEGNEGADEGSEAAVYWFRSGHPPASLKQWQPEAHVAMAAQPELRVGDSQARRIGESKDKYKH